MTTSIKAVRLHETGGPEKLVYEDVELSPPGPGEVQVRHGAIGLNFIDVYMRNGLYPLELPHVLGMEGAGEVVGVGDGVTDFAQGERVAYAAMPAGSYADARNIAADRLIKMPDTIDDKTAAAMMLQGLTAQYLLRGCYAVKAGDTILMHAAAGGVGLIVCQWAKALGATVIGTVGSKEKAELARSNGCDHAIFYRDENFMERVRELTHGEGVNVVYDSIGKDTFMDSLDCLRPLGTMVTFGNASGPVDPISPMVLAQKGSLFLTRPTIFTYIASRERLEAMAADLLEQVTGGKVNIRIGQEMALKDVAKAHQALEARETQGSTILIP